MKTTWVAGTAFIVRDGKALIVKRSEQDDWLPDYWEQVGGKFDWGETPEAGLAREVQEEAGLYVRPVRPYFVHRYINEERERYIMEIAYVCELVGSSEVMLSDEHSDYRWITEEELAAVSPISDEMRMMIQEGFRQISKI